MRPMEFPSGEEFHHLLRFEQSIAGLVVSLPEFAEHEVMLFALAVAREACRPN
jgi:hypothetical protein